MDMNTRIPAARSAAPAMSRPGRPPRGAGRAWAALEGLLAWANRKGPAIVAPATRAQEADAVRQYAWTFSRTDPRFAADLYAAADRHEIGEDANA